MPLPIARLSHLFARLESGEDSSDLKTLAQSARPWQPDLASWQKVAGQVCGLGSVLLLASALIFFFAYNWDALPKFAKLSIATAAVLVPAIVVIWAAGSGRIFGGIWRSAAFGASLCIGALLALIGQIYQTGADVWQLFALWALCMTPFVLLARSSASAVLWIVVVNVALWLLPGESETESVLRSTICNTVLLVLLEATYKRWLIAPRRWVMRLIAFSILWVLCGYSASKIGTVREGYSELTALYFLYSLGFGVFYLLKRDVPVLGMTLAGLVSWSIVWWVESIDWHGYSAIFWFLLLGIYILTASVLAGLWLLRLHRNTHESAQNASPTIPGATSEKEDEWSVLLRSSEPEMPIWMNVGLSLAAWASGMSILVALALLAYLMRQPEPMLVFGAVMIMVSLGLFRGDGRTPRVVFASQFALVLSFAGQVSFLFGLIGSLDLFESWTLLYFLSTLTL